MLRGNASFFFKLLVSFLLLSLLIYGGTGDHQLLNWDDRSYTVENPWVTNPNLPNIVSMFTEVRMANWHPLTWLSFVPEYALCGDAAICYKISNAVLHALNALLLSMFALVVFRIVQADKALPERFRTTIEAERLGLGFGQWIAVFTGVFFLVHPQHVESVTWVAERKDLLCALFYLLALISYCHYQSAGYLKRYGLTYLFFVLSLMSKSMAVSLPLALVLFDLLLLNYSELIQQRNYSLAVKRLLVEKLPFYATMFGAMLLTLLSQTPGRLEAVGLLSKLATVSAALQHYLLSFVLPIGFSPFYPQELAYNGLTNFLPGVLLCMLIVFVALKFRSHWWMRLLLLVLLFFLLTVAPVSGIVKIGEQAFADRYTYIPTMGFFVLVAWLLATLLMRVTRPAPVFIVAGCIALFTSAQSYAYKSVWRDDLVFWSSVVARYPDLAATPLNNLANSYAAIGDYERAAEIYRRSISVDATGLSAYLNLSSVYEFLGDRDGALTTLESGVRANPGSAGLKSRAGRALLLSGELERAAEYILDANQLQPDLADVQLSLGMLQLFRGEVNEAIGSLQSVSSTMPQHYEAGLLLVQAQSQLDPEQARQTLSRLIVQYGERDQLLELGEALAGQ